MNEEHNHVKKIMSMIRSGELRAEHGSAQAVEVAHDNWCGIFDGGLCQCDPDVRLRWTQPAGARN